MKIMFRKRNMLRPRKNKAMKYRHATFKKIIIIIIMTVKET